MKTTVISGITGQDGYFLSQSLISRGFEVLGIIRRNSSMTVGNLALLPNNIKEKVQIHYGDLTDANFLSKLLGENKPDYFYHLAAQSFVGYSFQNPSSTYDVNISGTLNVVNAIKDYSPDTRLYFAATSELYGQPKITPQNEETPFQPRSPYAISKLAGFWTVKNYREAYALYMSNGILFNHESEVRGPEFVTRKISMHVAKYASGDRTPLELGNMDARKDWGHARDYVEGMIKVLEYKYADDFVLGTGELHTVRDFVTEAFKVIGVDLHWNGKGINEVGLSDQDEVLVKVNKNFFRPLESDNYVADYSKARKCLGWEPKIRFNELVKLMVNSDIKRLGF
jgi:GDPmannose 4,6-dehydratase